MTFGRCRMCGHEKKPTSYRISLKSQPRPEQEIFVENLRAVDAQRTFLEEKLRQSLLSSGKFPTAKEAEKELVRLIGREPCTPPPTAQAKEYEMAAKLEELAAELEPDTSEKVDLKELRRSSRRKRSLYTDNDCLEEILYDSIRDRVLKKCDLPMSTAHVEGSPVAVACAAILERWLGRPHRVPAQEIYRLAAKYLDGAGIGKIVDSSGKEAERLIQEEIARRMAVVDRKEEREKVREAVMKRVQDVRDHRAKFGDGEDDSTDEEMRKAAEEETGDEDEEDEEPTTKPPFDWDSLDLDEQQAMLDGDYFPARMAAYDPLTMTAHGQEYDDDPFAYGYHARMERKKSNTPAVPDLTRTNQNEQQAMLDDDDPMANTRQGAIQATLAVRGRAEKASNKPMKGRLDPGD